MTDVGRANGRAEAVSITSVSDADELDLRESGRVSDSLDTDALDRLAHGPLYRFSEWEGDDTEEITARVASLPNGPPGAYTIWRKDEFVYVGVSYGDPSSTPSPRARGVAGRINTHASGRRAGDPFSMNVCDRFVLPSLNADEIAAVARGELSLDALTRAYIREHLSFRFVLTATGRDARRIERHIRTRGLASFGCPRLNPADRTVQASPRSAGESAAIGARAPWARPTIGSTVGASPDLSEASA